jgi:hypothetical protein
VPAAIVTVILVALVGLIGVAHRQGRISWLRRAGGTAERVSGGIPGWASLPVGMTTASLLTAVFGFYWDVSWHIDRGRDPGPFANPAHWFIIVGLGGIALAGLVSVLMGSDRPTPTSVRLADGWHVPVGGVLLMVCGLIALAGFPLDDVWHRIFGQDVTLWGPTHIQMIGGASLSTLATWVLLNEGIRAAPRRAGWLVEHQAVLVGGAFLLGLSTLQGEFDYGVPQFRQLYHPVLIMLAAGIGLVAVRILAGRGGAIGAALFFIAVRGTLTILIGPLLGRSTLHFPLYLIEAVIVEVVAVVVGTERQLTFGVWSGVGIGTIGLTAEWLWSHLWMPLPWHAGLLPEAAIFGALAAVSGALIGGLIGRALQPSRAVRQSAPRGLVACAWLIAVLCVSWPLPMTSSGSGSATVALSGVPDSGYTLGAPVTSVNVSVRMDQPAAAARANWFDVTAWQGEKNGDGGLVIASLHRRGDGSYATTKAVPIGGSWKTIIRLQKGRELVSLPVYLPADLAIPVPAVLPRAQWTAAFVRDKSVLQREATGGSIALQRGAYVLLSLLAVAWIVNLAWGLRLLDRAGGRRGALANA